MDLRKYILKIIVNAEKKESTETISCVQPKSMKESKMLHKYFGHCEFSLNF